MTSSADRPTPDELLGQVRERVEAQVRDGTAGTPSEVRSSTSLRPLPDELRARLDERRQQKLTPTGAEYPRQAVLKIAAVAAAVGGVGVIIFVLGLVTGDAGLIAIGAAELVIFGGGGVGLYRYAQQDPLRLSPAQLTTVENSRRWTPPANSTDALLAVAATSAQRVVDTPVWRTGALTEAGVLVRLGPALDAIAAAGPDQLTQVAALTAYADSVETLRGGTGELDATRIELLAYLLSNVVRDGR